MKSLFQLTRLEQKMEREPHQKGWIDFIALFPDALESTATMTTRGTGRPLRVTQEGKMIRVKDENELCAICRPDREMLGSHSVQQAHTIFGRS